MTIYYIRTEATEDRPEMVCSYPFQQWKELIDRFKKAGIKFHAWKEEQQ